MSSRSTAPSYHPGPSRPSDAGSTAASRFDPARFFHLGNDDHFYRPVIQTCFYLGWRAFGCDARGFHLLSIGIHLLVIGAVYLSGTFATKGAARCAERTQPYRAFVEEIGRSNPAPKPFDTVGVSAATARPIPELYRDVAAQAAFCMDTLRVTIR